MSANYKLCIVLTMGKRFLALILSSLLLTGCSSGTTAEEEAKLIEYKSCLDAELSRFIAMGGEWAAKANEYAQSRCAIYKP